MRIFACQINPIVGDLKGNTQRILQGMQNARAKKADLVAFPEMAICGYPPEDLLMHPSFIDAIQKHLEEIVQNSKGLSVVVGLVRPNPSGGEKSLFNSAAVIHDGKLLGFSDKCLLPTYDVFDERRYFEPGKAPKVWNVKNQKVAVMICEDIWQHAGEVGYTNYRQDPVNEIAQEKPDLLINISASPYHFQKPDVRVRVCAKSAKTLQCPVILCCQVGGNDQLVFDGYSMCVDGQGDLRHVAAGFKEEELLIDTENFPPATSLKYDSFADLYQALVLGTRDYFHKLGFKKGCFGLSGGIDSALVACIAVDALGKENVLALAMPSRFSSSQSLADAQELASNLGIELKELSIEKPFEAYLQLLKPSFAGKEFDVTEENIQARIRGMILMAFSNKFGYIVLSTGNKSEMGMGYSTLYGDMCGGLAVISDVTKTKVYLLAEWINQQKKRIPESIMKKAPSAELRLNQKDSDTMPEYSIIDHVLQAYVEECLSPEEISKKFQIPFDTVFDLVKRIHAAEYKRRQSPPCIRVTKKAFLVGRRYPIVQRWL
jgi:NAD+ synthase (glutamine-hydrolysing)